MFHIIRVRLYFLPIWAWQIMPIIIAGVLTTSVAYGALLGERYLNIASDLPGANTTYQLALTTTTNETLGSIEIQFCSNSPIISMSCVPSTGDLSGVILQSQSGTSGFSVGSLNNNTIILTRSPSVQVAGTMIFTFSNAINPSSQGTFYGRIQTFSSSNASGNPLDFGGLAMAILNSYSISTTVLPYLLFCAGASIPGYDCNQSSGNLINFGSLSPSFTATAQSELLVATNANNGYTIQVSGSSLTSGNYVVSSLASDSVAQPGEDQFGINLVANNLPAVGSGAQGPGIGNPAPGYGVSNEFQFQNGSIIAESNGPSDYKKYTVSYIVNISPRQEPGVYASTLTYVGVGNF